MKALFALLFLITPVVAQDQATVDRALAACGPIAVRFNVQTNASQHPVAQPEHGRATVYVVQDGRFFCIFCSTTTRVGVDGAWVGANDGFSYFFFAAEPGEHHLCTDQQTKNASDSRIVALNSFTADAGRTYYFRVRVRAEYNAKQQVIWTLDLDQINSDEGQFLVASSAFSTWRMKK